MKIIAVANQKGGVGKTSLCLHMAGTLAERGSRVLVVDMDQQGNLSAVLADPQHPGCYSVADLLMDEPAVRAQTVVLRTPIPQIDLLPATGTLSELDARLAQDDDAVFYLRDALADLQGDYDAILIDCPPNLDRATRMALVAADAVLIPIECQDWAVRGSNQMMALIERVQRRTNPRLRLLGFVINKYKPRRTLEQDYNQALRAQYGAKVFQTELGDYVQYAEAAAERRPITHYHPTSEHAQAYRRLIEELLQHGAEIVSRSGAANPR